MIRLYMRSGCGRLYMRSGCGQAMYEGVSVVRLYMRSGCGQTMYKEWVWSDYI